MSKAPYINWAKAPLGTTHAYIGEGAQWQENGTPICNTDDKRKFGWTQIFPDRTWHWHDRFGWCAYARLAGDFVDMTDYVEKPTNGQCAQVDVVMDGLYGVLPTAGTDHAAGYDVIYCCENGYDKDLETDEITIAPGEIVKVPTGLKMAVPGNVALLVLPRSGMSTKRKLRPANTPGLIDPDYRGEIIVALENFGDQPQSIRHGERIAQLVFVPFIKPVFYEVMELDETVRGSGGFGSTGIYS